MTELTVVSCTADPNARSPPLERAPSTDDPAAHSLNTPQAERIYHKEIKMETDEHTRSLHSYFCDREFLNRMKALTDSKMIPGDSEVASTLMAKAVALVADGEPICIGLNDDNPLFILDPRLMGYFYGREPYQLDHTVEWLEELRVVLGTMAANLRSIRDRMETDAE